MDGTSTTPIYDQSSKNIQATAGQKFIVMLPANITTPMQWRIDPEPDSSLLTMVSKEYVDKPPKECPNCVGYGGTRIFYFKAHGAGETKLHFKYVGLGATDEPPEKQVDIDLHIIAAEQ